MHCKMHGPAGPGSEPEGTLVESGNWPASVACTPGAFKVLAMSACSHRAMRLALVAASSQRDGLAVLDGVDHAAAGH